jgi:hypothetical protein
MVLPDLREVERESVQIQLNARKNEVPEDFWMGTTARNELLSFYGSAQRKREQVAYYRNPRNWMLQGAFAGMTKKWSTSSRSSTGRISVLGGKPLCRWSASISCASTTALTLS